MATKINPEVADEKRNQADVEVLDVRTDEEVEEGMIPDAIHIPLDQIENKVDDLDEDKEYITVCASGRRSDQAADILNEQGYQAQTLDGGMHEWNGEVTQ
ncbi:Rhodanese-related sulfurtransferase [Thalassobacillus cyri]|uniref:Rhodanese-related sulfurtransferase n=1 Tax=Thalassobacillus cyri TaxID=571932 RepID=A0A1H4AXQ0_9BACI|nr:rhodanese-like domain-containing protein [Thalassobacillus cyri]SEA40661.1 Rhodanese-related sulfurtransferase [Thalassobacillus cyri]